MNPVFFQRITITLLLLALMSCGSGESGTATLPAMSDALSCNNISLPRNSLPPTIHYEVVNRYPHSTVAFTQGLDYHNGILVESTGLYGQSTLSASRLGDPQPLNTITLDDSLFGEGATLYNNEIIQLTWKSGRAFRYRADDLSLLNEYRISGEGWGITHNKHQLITSDGSATLTFRNPETLEAEKQLGVTFAGRLLKNINELEWVNGCVLANVWQTDTIAVIDPDSGTTVYTIDLSALAKPEKLQNPQHVANGIAWREDNGNLLVTGKNWQYIYELELLLP